MLEVQKTLRLGKHFIGYNKPVFIIAEIGINHEGSAETCEKMIMAAAEAGADAVKFQTIDPDENYVSGTESYRLFKGSELTREETARMFELSRSLGVEPFTTCGDLKTIAWVDELKPAAYKISSGLLSHIPFIKKIALLGKPLLISTGMATWQDIDDVMNVVERIGEENIGLFQCTSLYPAPMDALNLAGISALSNKYKVPVGFSDHTAGVEAAPLAIAAGACMVEKHFTLDSKRSSYDHHISLEPEAFSEMVKKIRCAEIMMGSAEKALSEVLKKNKERYDRCLVARDRIKVGEVLTEDNVTVKRPLPGKRGLAPKYFEQVLGRCALKSMNKDDPVVNDCIEDIT